MRCQGQLRDEICHLLVFSVSNIRCYVFTHILHFAAPPNPQYFSVYFPPFLSSLVGG